MYTLKQKYKLCKSIIMDYMNGDTGIRECVISRGLSLNTFYLWLERDEFKALKKRLNSIQAARQRARVDAAIEEARNALEKRISGYEYKETVVEAKISKDGKVAKPHSMKTYQKHVSPNVTAALGVLKLYDKTANVEPEDTSPKKTIILHDGTQIER